MDQHKHQYRQAAVAVDEADVRSGGSDMPCTKPVKASAVRPTSSPTKKSRRASSRRCERAYFQGSSPWVATGAHSVDSFEQAVLGQGTLFRYDFDAPDTVGTVGGSLGNDIETIIGPGDSALTEYGSGFALVGINTFTEGYGGLFGDTGGGVALND